MKKFVSTLLLCGALSGAYAQKKLNVVQAGIGFGNSLDYVSGAKGMPTLNFTYERMLPFKAGPGTFGAGITASYRKVNWKSTYADYEGVETNAKWKHSNAIVALRGAYHLNADIIKVENLDLYGAVQLGARFWSSKYTASGDYGEGLTNSKDTDVHFGLVAGARYYFTPNFGVYSEVGYDVTWIKIGIAGRF